MKVAAMDNGADGFYRGRCSSRDVHYEVLTFDSNSVGGIRIASEGLLQVSKSTDLGLYVRDRGIKFLNATRNEFEALRMEADDQLFVYSIYDRAREFFGVNVLTVGQMPVFRAALSFGLVH
jgi:hypothetical protein